MWVPVWLQVRKAVTFTCRGSSGRGRRPTPREAGIAFSTVTSVGGFPGQGGVSWLERMRKVDEPSHRLLTFFGLGVVPTSLVSIGPDGQWYNAVLDVGSESGLDELEAAQAIDTRDRWRLARGHAGEECPQVVTDRRREGRFICEGAGFEDLEPVEVG